MAVRTTVEKAIKALEYLCESYEKSPLNKFKDLEETVTNLSHEVQALDLASNQSLKNELNTLQSALSKLGVVLKQQQEGIERHVNEIYVHQRALHAYAYVANNNPSYGAS